MTYEERLKTTLGVPDAEHYKWHALFGSDCRYPNCPLRKEAPKK